LSARESLRERLRREAREYLADLRQFADALRRVEGWVTLGLLVLVGIISIEWFITGLGFDRLNPIAGTFGVWRPRLCRPMDDIPALIVIIDATAMVLLSVMTLGEMMRLLDRVRQGLPKRPREVALPAVAMLIVSVAGIVYMRFIC
jgi:formate hydrogenlyase subunit 3/multisubunit Na+/H+ antiporter MnhD subunit